MREKIIEVIRFCKSFLIECFLIEFEAVGVSNHLEGVNSFV